MGSFFPLGFAFSSFIGPQEISGMKCIHAKIEHI